MTIGTKADMRSPAMRRRAAAGAARLWHQGREIGANALPGSMSAKLRRVAGLLSTGEIDRAQDARLERTA